MKFVFSTVAAVWMTVWMSNELEVSASLFNIFRPSNENTEQRNSALTDTDSLPTIRGVPDNLISQYEQDHFVCDGGRTVLRTSQINDGYCDCKDGKDEPGTSACSQGTFYCRNKGYKVISMPSSRVDDGICDCCDGSDEPAGSCANTCQTVAARERASLERSISAFKVGNVQRKEFVSRAQEQIRSQANQLPILSKEIDRLRAEQASVQQESDSYLKALSSSRDQSISGNKILLENLIVLDPHNTEYMVQLIQNLAEVLDLTEDQLDGLMSFSPASRDTGLMDHHEEADEYGDDHHNSIPSHCPVIASLTVPSTLLSGLCQLPDEKDVYTELTFVLHQMLKNYRPYSELFYLLGHYQLQRHQWTAEAVDYARNALVDTDPVVDDGAASAAAAAGDNKQCPADFAVLSNEFCLFPERVKELLEPIVSQESAQEQDGTYLTFKQRLHQINNDLQNMEQRRSEAQSSYDKSQRLLNPSSASSAMSLAQTEGELAFGVLKDQCFDVVDGKFSYSLCVMQKVNQKEEHGNFNTVSLGQFDSLEAVSPTVANQGAAYVMHFTNGQYCHAHGPRKADVTVRCGESNRLLSAAEPSTCFYALQMESPVACTQEYASVQGILPYV